MLSRLLAYLASALLFFSTPVFASDAPSPSLDEVTSKPRLSIAFSSADISNPESVFGHVFLIAHDDRGVLPSSPVVEFYGLLGRVDMGMLKTVVSSIPGVYKLDTFAEKRRLYDKEGRDLYVRTLRAEVSPSDVYSRLASFWSKEIPYDFLDENCAFHIERLLVQNSGAFESAWKIRQPHDVFIKYGNPAAEMVFYSSSRMLAQAQFVGDPTSASYYRSRLTLLTHKAGTNIDQAASDLWKNQPPPLAVKAPDSDWEKRAVRLAHGSDSFVASVSGFDTVGLLNSDPLPRLSRMSVGEVSLFCLEDCGMAVGAFEVQTVPQTGWGKTKTLSLMGYYRRGLEVAGRIGLGFGYTRSALGVSLTPLLGYDSASHPQIGIEARIVWDAQRLGGLAWAQSFTKEAFNPVYRDALELGFSPSSSGLYLRHGNRSGLLLGYKSDF